MEEEKIKKIYDKYFCGDKEELSDEESKKFFLELFFLLYEYQKKSANYDAYDFYDFISTEDVRKNLIKSFGIVYDLESIRLFKEASEEFKGLFCTGQRPQKSNNKSNRLGTFKTLLAIIAGISEGLDKK